MRCASPPTTSRRSASMSCNTNWSTSSRDRPDTSSGVYVEPPPTTATFIDRRLSLPPAGAGLRNRLGGPTGPLALHPRQRHALDEGALREEEEDDHRRHHEDRRRHRQVPLHLVLRAELREPEREHPVVRVLADVEQRQEEVVERVEEREQRNRGDRGLREPRHDGEEDAKLAAAVDARCVEVLLGDRQEELPQQEDRERVAEPVRDDQRPERSDQVQL